jgi:hypothetical protein
MTDRERQYKADLKRIEQIKEEIRKLREEKEKLIQRTYYFEHREEKLEKNKTNRNKKG